VKKIELKIGLPEHILNYINRGSENESAAPGFADVFKNLEEEGGIESEKTEEDEADESAVASSAIIQLGSRMLLKSSKRDASDIHVEPGMGREPGMVRVRVDGEGHELLQSPGDHVAALLARIKVMSRLDISERRKPQDGKCKLKIGKRNL